MKVNWELCPRQWRELKRLNSSGSQEAGRQQLWEDLEAWEREEVWPSGQGEVSRLLPEMIPSCSAAALGLTGASLGRSCLLRGAPLFPSYP